jgi:predicted dehydrogenase
MEDAFLPGVGAVELTERRAGATTSRGFDGANEYVLMVEHFADAVLGRTVLRYSASEAAANMAVIDALYRSARSGRSEVVDR